MAAAVSPLSRLLAGLDPDPRVRGDQFERLCLWLLRNDPVYRERLRGVWRWADWPRAWGADAGIDLIAEEGGGGLWAVQAKAYAPDYAIKKADIDSFLSESSRAGFTYRLLIATTDQLGATARRTLHEQERPAGYLLRSQLEAREVRWPRSLAALRPAGSRPRKPFPYQRAAVRDAVRGLHAAERGQLVMAAGTGKTLVGLWTAEKLAANRVLVLVPSISLLAQTLRVWSATADSPFRFLAVCSDRTVAGEDEVVAHTSELGVPVTTSPTAIVDFLRGRGRRVVFSTYQSSPQIAQACAFSPPRFDLVIADEAHRTAGRVVSFSSSRCAKGTPRFPIITSKMAFASACGSRTAAQTALDCRLSGKRHLSRYRGGRGTPRRRNGARATLASGRTRIGKGTLGCPRAIRRMATAWGRG